jgi:hypothetical protein
VNAQFVRQVVNRVRTEGMEKLLPWSLGRFATVRRIYGQTLGAAQAVGAVPGLKAVTKESLFPGRSASQLARGLASDSAFFGLTIPQPQLGALIEAIDRSHCVSWGTHRRFRPSELNAEGRLPDGTPVILADVEGIGLDPTARRIATDPLLLSALEIHLGYRPVQVDVRALKSFVCSVSDDERRAVQQTIDYHFDVHSYSFGYANFYLSDVDADSGAHVMVLGSHRDKPVAWLFDSSRRSDPEIEKYYPADRIRTITGRAGVGFLQDSSCYHKVLRPKGRVRTMLHVRYY